MARTKQVYADNGVELSKTTLTVGDEVTLYYKGLWHRAEQMLYLHILDTEKTGKIKRLYPCKRRTMSSRQPSRLIMPMTLI